MPAGVRRAPMRRDRGGLSREFSRFEAAVSYRQGLSYFARGTPRVRKFAIGVAVAASLTGRRSKWAETRLPLEAPKGGAEYAESKAMVGSNGGRRFGRPSVFGSRARRS